jgi:UDP-3-O-[3-hydroxymyristoyl] glucosamine N-acyltransferase
VVSSLVNISHNVSIGSACRVGAGACILGSSRIENKAWIGPNSTVANRIRIGEVARVSLGSVVVRDVAGGETVSGNFAVPHAEFLNQYRRLRSRSGKNRS